MKKLWMTTLAALALPGLLAAPAVAGDKPKPCVTFAKTWEAAVEEAQLLNVPIVVHSHGFYCGPCWGMHSSLLQNKKYIKFAERNTVEVISLGALDEGIAKQDRRAATYTAREKDGREVEYLMEWPNLTVADIEALRTSKAGQYNDTGKIPYTAVIDPYTLEQTHKWSGGQAASTIMEAVEEVKKRLVKEHGSGIERRDIARVDAAAAEADELALAGEFAKAMAEVDKLSKDAQDWPQAFQERIGKIRSRVLEAAKKAIAALEARAGEDPAAAKRELTALSYKLRGTGLEEQVEALLASL